MIEILLVILFGWLLNMAINQRPMPMPRVMAKLIHAQAAMESARLANQAQLEAAMKSALSNQERFALQPFDSFFERPYGK